MGCLSALCFWATGVISQGKCETYGDTWGLIVGEKTKIIPSLFLTLNGLITAAQYAVIIGDQLYAGMAMHEWGLDILKSNDKFAPGRFLILGVVCCGIYPLALLKNMAPLKYPSMLGII